jgi:hypothetical protein
MVGKITELSACDSRTGISASRDDDDANDDGTLSASLFVGEKLIGICFRRLRIVVFGPFICLVNGSKIRFARK